MRMFFYVVWQIFYKMIFAPAIIATGMYLYGLKFWPSFIAMFGFNWLVGSIFNIFAIRNRDKHLFELEKEYTDILKHQSLKVKCAYCGSPNQVPVDLGAGGFTCKNCGKTNKMYISFRAAQIGANYNITDAENDEGNLNEGQ